MAGELTGLWIGLAGGASRAVVGFVYRKAKNSGTRFRLWKFFATLIECSAAGLVIGMSIPVAGVKAGVALALAAAGFSELLGKTGLHDVLGLKK